MTCEELSGASASRTALSSLRDEAPAGLHPDGLQSHGARGKVLPAEYLGAIYREIQAQQYACDEIVCVYPHDGNCWCFNEALAQFMEQTK